jgi:membrane protein implicated in regulation of membrane protease activity
MSDLNYDEIRRRAEKRANKRKELFMHVGIYIIVNLFLWLIFGILSAVSASPALLLIPLLSTLGWGIGVAIHAVVTFAETTALDSMREREIEREIQREMRLRGNPDMLEKPKREQTVRLSDDGELVYDDEPPEQVRRTRSRGR